MPFAKFLTVLCFGLFWSVSAAAPAKDFAVVHGWPLLPEGRTLGMVAGVAVNSKNEVFVFDRGMRGWKEPLSTDLIVEPTIKVFDGRTGRLLRQFGAGIFAMPHGISIDPQDHIWLTNVALNQVVELDGDGKIMRTLGERGKFGSDAGHFNKPTDVAFTSDGAVLVSDGYGNARIVEFSGDGRFRRQWGGAGKAVGQFDIPHALAVDADDRIYVADRENDRVQIFDRNGGFVAQWSSPAIGRPLGLLRCPTDRLP